MGDNVVYSLKFHFPRGNGLTLRNLNGETTMLEVKVLLAVRMNNIDPHSILLNYGRKLLNDDKVGDVQLLINTAVAICGDRILVVEIPQSDSSPSSEGSSEDESRNKINPPNLMAPGVTN